MVSLSAIEMFNPDEKEEFHENQVRILRLLLEKPYQQKGLAEAMGMSGAGLLYHLDILGKKRFIIKKTIAQVGNASLNEISINPNAIQRTRRILNLEPGSYTLITGFGKDSALGKSSTLPSVAKSLLEQEDYKIGRTVAFTTPDSSLDDAKKLARLDKIIEAEYHEYRDEDSPLMKNLEGIIQVEQKDKDLIFDLTPLTKLLTIRLLDLSYKYKIPSFYTGIKESGENHLIWIYSPGSTK
nr:ArsR family transcriptional regulator [Candidatus Sigynarchaeota archaeon]